MKKLKLYIDLDGTVLHVAPRYLELHQRLIREHSGNSLAPERLWALKQSRTCDRTIAWVCGLSETGAASYRRMWEQEIESPQLLAYDRPFDGMYQILGELSQENRLVLVTLRRDRTALLGQLKRLNLDRYFEGILLRGSRGLSPGQKVRPPLIKARLIEGDLSSSTIGGPAIIIGDTEVDVMAGKALKIASCAVWSGLRTRKFLSSLAPDFLLSDLSRLPLLLCDRQRRIGR